MMNAQGMERLIFFRINVLSSQPKFPFLIFTADDGFPGNSFLRRGLCTINLARVMPRLFVEEDLYPG